MSSERETLKAILDVLARAGHVVAERRNLIGGALFDHPEIIHHIAIEGTPRDFAFEVIQKCITHANPTDADTHPLALVLEAVMEGVDAEQQRKIKNWIQEIEGRFSLTIWQRSLSSLHEAERQPTHQRDMIIQQNWEQVRSQSRRITKITLSDSRYRAKYQQATHVPRESVHTEVQSFLKSTKQTMVITGRTGTGKSSLVCHLMERLEDHVVPLLIDCKVDFPDAEVNLDRHLSKKLELSHHFLESVTPWFASHPQETFLLVLDAVNEATYAETLMAAVREFVIRIETPNIKVLVTARLPAWTRLSTAYQLADTTVYYPRGGRTHLELGGFTDAELKLAYQLYTANAKQVTPFEDLKPPVRKTLSQPIFMMITTKACENAGVPQSRISLSKVFKDYVAVTLGRGDNTRQQVLILRRAIELMYDKRKKKLERNVLQSDEKIGDMISEPPYMTLLDVGIISEDIEEIEAERHTNDADILSRYEDEDDIFGGLEDDTDILGAGSQDERKRLQKVFITFEIVFEYLLYDMQLRKADLSEDFILQQLEAADNPDSPFISLRGAVELALAIRLIDAYDTPEMPSFQKVITRFACSTEPGMRRFVINVLHIIQDAGGGKVNEALFNAMMNSKHDEARLAVAHAAYELNLPTQLVDLALHNSPQVRTIAASFIYMRWLRTYRNGQLAEAYDTMKVLIGRVNGINIRRSISAINAIISVGVYILPHFVERDDLLDPILNDLRNGIETFHDDRGNADDFARVAGRTQGLLKLLSGSLLGLVKRGISLSFQFYVNFALLDSKEFLNTFRKSGEAKRAFMDASVMVGLPNLQGQEQHLQTLLQHDHIYVRAFIRFPILHHVAMNPEVHIPLMQQQIKHVSVDGQVSIVWCMVNGLYARVMRFGADAITQEQLEIAQQAFTAVWFHVQEIRKFEDVDGIGYGGNEDKPRLIFMANLAYGIFLVERQLQLAAGRSTGSDFLNHFLSRADVTLDEKQTDQFITMLERCTYRGYATFATQTLLLPVFADVWQKSDTTRQRAIQALGHFRSFFPDEVDAVLETMPEHEALWQTVRSEGVVPDAQYVTHASTVLIPVAGAVSRGVLKVGGGIVYELTASTSMDDFVNRMTHLLLGVLSDFDHVNVGVVLWYQAHLANWDDYDVWGLTPEMANPDYKPDIYNYYHSMIDQFLEENGRGRFGDALYDQRS